VNTFSYKPLVGISPSLQLRCSWRQRWVIRFWGQKVEDQGHRDVLLAGRAYRLTVRRRWPSSPILSNWAFVPCLCIFCTYFYFMPSPTTVMFSGRPTAVRPLSLSVCYGNTYFSWRALPSLLDFSETCHTDSSCECIGIVLSINFLFSFFFINPPCSQPRRGRPWNVFQRFGRK